MQEVSESFAINSISYLERLTQCHDFHLPKKLVQAGFKIGMSDGGLVTEAKPSIQWDKVGQT